MLARPTDMYDPNYFKNLTIWHNQINQDQENTAAHDNFVTAAASWVAANEGQQAHNLPLTGPPPQPPKRKNYNDDGTITETDFPDLKIPTLAPTGKDAPSTGKIYTGTQQTMTQDQKLDTIIMLLNVLVGGK